MKKSLPLWGAVAGDVIGSVYEFGEVRNPDFALFSSMSDFTDDTVLTMAVAHSILTGEDFGESLWDFGNRYPGRGYGGRFYQWLLSFNPQPYNSYGNGSAMRVSPVGAAFDRMETVLQKARESAEPTHNHPEGIKGAQATAAAILLARQGASKQEIKTFVSGSFGYDLDFSLDEIRPHYHFNETCQETVPQAIVAFLESTDWTDAVRKAVWLNGDSDTLANITGGIAAAFYKEIPDEVIRETARLLPEEFLRILDHFDRTE